MASPNSEDEPPAESDASFVSFLTLEFSARVDESSEAIIGEETGMHLPCWESILHQARSVRLRE